MKNPRDLDYSLMVKHIKDQFDCPICHSEAYHYVIAKSADGRERATALYQCAGCTVTFTDPRLFTQRRRMILEEYPFQRDEQGEPIWRVVAADGGANYHYHYDMPRRLRKPRRESGSDR